MAETTAQTLTRLRKALANREAKLKVASDVLGVRHEVCKAQAQSIKTLKEVIEELSAEAEPAKVKTKAPRSTRPDLIALATAAFKTPQGEDHE